jgi:hypothetical protein
MTDTQTPDRPPDRPPVPRPKRSVLAAVMLAFSVLVLGGYTALAITQHELGTQEHDAIPSSVRSSPGGYRSYSFWHTGYHGGK